MVDSTDLIENTIGAYGRWQFVLISLIFFSRFSVAFHQLMMVVQHSVPIFNCSDPDVEDPCDENCPGFTYIRIFFEESVVTQWDLVCERRWISSFIQSVVMFGILLGNVSLGWVSDKFGRKNIMIAEIFLQVIAGTLAAFMPNLIAFIVMRFLSAYATGGMMLTGFVLMMEFVEKKKRALIGIAFHIPFQVGHAALGLIAYLLPRWNHIQLFCSLVNVVLFVFICTLPESVRWLITKERRDEVIKTLEKAAKCNRMPIEAIAPNVDAFLKEHAHAEQVKTGRFTDLFQSKRMRMKVCILAINWFVVANLFYGVAELMGKIGGNLYLNVGLAGVVEVVGTLLCMILCAFIGNKFLLIISYVITFVPMFVMMVLPVEPHWPFVMCGCISMMGCAMNFSIIYLYTVELLPTVIRNIGMGMTSMIARIGSMLAPYIMLSKFYSTVIPYIIFGVLPVLAALLTLFFLPETKNIEMPDTVEDADKV